MEAAPVEETHHDIADPPPAPPPEDSAADTEVGAPDPAPPDAPPAPAPSTAIPVDEPWRGVTPRRVDALPCGAWLVVSQGSVVAFQGDALVNAANNRCLGGGGVDGAVNDAGGWKLEDARWALPVVSPPNVRCRTGDAVATVGGDLAVEHVIHAVGPDYRDYDEDSDGDAALRSAYAAAMRVAQQLEVTTLAFALISASIYRAHRPLLAVLRVAVRAVREGAYTGLREVHLVGFTAAELKVLLAAAEAEAGEGGQGGASGGATDAEAQPPDEPELAMAPAPEAAGAPPVPTEA